MFQNGRHYVSKNHQLLRKSSRKKSVYFCNYKWKKKTLFVKTIASPITTTRRFFPICKYHNILLGDAEDLLRKLDTSCFTYQHVDCLYTLFKYRFSGTIIAKSGNVFDKVQRATIVNQRNRGVYKMPSTAKKRLLRKNFEQHFMSALQKNKSTQTSGSVFAKKN